MSQIASSEVRSPAREKAAAPAASIPVDLWPVLVEHICQDQDYFLILSRSDLRIEYANKAFDGVITSAWRDVTLRFSETLVPGLAAALQARLAAGQEPVDMEVYHEIPCGARPVLYTFRAQGDRWLAFGKDQSVQLELVAQLATLVNDLEVRCDHEKERSEALKELSEKDALTGLANRRAFEAIYRAHLQKYREGGAVFSLLCIDVDRFKGVNDRYGHPMGDEVLRRVARVLESRIRDGDRLARTGGEEFVIIARGAELRAAAELAERLRLAVAQAPMPPPLPGLTVSIGVSCVTQLPEKAEGADQDLLSLADKALYEAKNAGRNTVRC